MFVSNVSRKYLIMDVNEIQTGVISFAIGATAGSFLDSFFLSSEPVTNQNWLKTGTEVVAQTAINIWLYSNIINFTARRYGTGASGVTSFTTIMGLINSQHNLEVNTKKLASFAVSTFKRMAISMENSAKKTAETENMQDFSSMMSVPLPANDHIARV